MKPKTLNLILITNLLFLISSCNSNNSNNTKSNKASNSIENKIDTTFLDNSIINKKIWVDDTYNFKSVKLYFLVFNTQKLLVEYMFYPDYISSKFMWNKYHSHYKISNDTLIYVQDIYDDPNSKTGYSKAIIVSQKKLDFKVFTINKKDTLLYLKDDITKRTMITISKFIEKHKLNDTKLNELIK